MNVKFFFLLLFALIKSFLCFLHSHIIISVGGEPKRLSAARFPCFSAQFTTSILYAIL